MIPDWAGRYVRLPFKDKGRGVEGFDCWGLVMHILEHEFKVSGLPDYSSTYAHTTDEDLIPIAIRDGLKEGYWNKVSEPKLGDMLIFNIGNKPMHCALVLGDGKMIHAQESIGITVDGYHRPNWKKRIEGFYRHDSLR